MGGGVSEHAECSNDQVGETALFALFAVRGKGVNGEDGRIAGQGLLGQGGCISGQAGFRSQFISDALCRFENGMEIVVGDKFSAAEAQDIGMDAAGCKVGPQLLSTAGSFRESLSVGNCVQRSGSVNSEA